MQKTISLKNIMLIVLAFLFISYISIGKPEIAGAASQDVVLEITGEGVDNPITYSREELEDMEQYQQTYSVINSWPTKKFYTGKGVKLSNLLDKAGIKEEAKVIKFTSQDGYTVTLTVHELLEDKRYYFPHFKEDGSKDGDGVLVGSTHDAQLVEPIIALVFVEGSNNPAYMNDFNSPILMLGQRSITEQTGNLLVKYLNKIEVLNTEPLQWDKPQANPSSGVVPAGTMVALNNRSMDDDKIYYTTDGTTPNLNSNMYNKIAKRWWSARADVLAVHNSPIGPINENTIIKAITIGPGKKDSEVVTFTYEIEGSKNDEKDILNNQNDDVAKDNEEEDNTNEIVIFDDIKNHWAKDNIERLITTGSISGYPDGTFKPEQTITRAEFASMLCNVFKFENKGNQVFVDTREHWAKENISKATVAGVVSGYNEDVFGPNDLITREQMAVMIARAVKLPLITEDLAFSDNENISSWAKSAMTAVYKNKIMKGYPDNTIKPQGKATRAEAVTVIINALEPK